MEAQSHYPKWAPPYSLMKCCDSNKHFKIKMVEEGNMNAILDGGTQNPKTAGIQNRSWQHKICFFFLTPFLLLISLAFIATLNAKNTRCFIHKEAVLPNNSDNKNAWFVSGHSWASLKKATLAPMISKHQPTEQGSSRVNVAGKSLHLCENKDVLCCKILCLCKTSSHYFSDNKDFLLFVHLFNLFSCSHLLHCIWGFFFLFTTSSETSTLPRPCDVPLVYFRNQYDLQLWDEKAHVWNYNVPHRSTYI